MGIFYAYAKNIRNGWTWRYIITFASRDVADEWWRTVSSNPRFAEIKRVTPQFYTHDPDVGIRITDTVSTTIPDFLNRVFFTLLNDEVGRGLSMIPEQDIKDHVSGGLFFIRSKTDPREYWYCPDSGERFVFTSRLTRTLFRVRVANSTDNSSARTTVMIKSDPIYITLASSADVHLSAANGGSIRFIPGGPPLRLVFEDFKNGFKAGGPLVTTHCGDVAELVNMIFQVEQGNGEEWELA